MSIAGMKSAGRFVSSVMLGAGVAVTFMIVVLLRTLKGVVMGLCVASKSARHAKGVTVDRHHIVPLAAGGLNNVENIVPLCPNHHRAVHQLLRAWAKAGGQPAWLVRVRYGKVVRDLAATGYAGTSPANRAALLVVKP